MTHTTKGKEKKINLIMGSLGNGITCVDTNREEHGDYKIIAHISPYGKISYRENNLPQDIKKRIEAEAKRIIEKYYK